MFWQIAFGVIWLLGIAPMSINYGAEYKEVPLWLRVLLVAIWPGTVIAGAILYAVGWVMDR